MLNEAIHSTFNIQHSTFPFSCSGRASHRYLIERYDHQRLIILRRPVPRELPNRPQQRLFDLLRREVSVLEDRFLEAVEAERVAVVVDRFDQAVAVEDEAVAGGEVDGVLAERLAASDAQREPPGRQGLDARLVGAEDVRVEM